MTMARTAWSSSIAAKGGMPSLGCPSRIEAARLASSPPYFHSSSSRLFACPPWSSAPWQARAPLHERVGHLALPLRLGRGQRGERQQACRECERLRLLQARPSSSVAPRGPLPLTAVADERPEHTRVAAPCVEALMMTAREAGLRRPRRRLESGRRRGVPARAPSARAGSRAGAGRGLRRRGSRLAHASPGSTARERTLLRVGLRTGSRPRSRTERARGNGPGRAHGAPAREGSGPARPLARRVPGRLRRPVAARDVDP